jgi:hypothetical protein
MTHATDGTRSATSLATPNWAIQVLNCPPGHPAYGTRHRGFNGASSPSSDWPPRSATEESATACVPHNVISA